MSLAALYDDEAYLEEVSYDVVFDGEGRMVGAERVVDGKRFEATADDALAIGEAFHKLSLRLRLRDEA